jgi:hypothetical protein
VRVSSRRGARRAHAGAGHGVFTAKPRARHVPSRPAAPAGGDACVIATWPAQPGGSGRSHRVEWIIAPQLSRRVSCCSRGICTTN